MNKNLQTTNRAFSGSFTTLNYFRVRAGFGPDLVGPLTTLVRVNSALQAQILL